MNECESDGCYKIDSDRQNDDHSEKDQEFYYFLVYQSHDSCDCGRVLNNNR